VVELEVNIGTKNMEFISFRGQQLEATIISAGGQDFVIAPIGDRMDRATAEILAQQNIAIVPGLKITEKTTGTLFQVLSKPEGYSRLVRIKDIRRNLTPVNIPEDELRQKYRFTSM